MTRKGLLTIFGIISLTGFLVHCGQEDTAFTSQDASAFAGKVAGRVVDKNGSAVNGALVTLRPGGTTTVSGDSGKYEFGSVTSGKYRVEFTKADYRDTARRDSVTLGLLQTDSLGASPLCYRYATVSGSIPNLSNASSVSVVVENQGATVTAVSNEHFILTKVDPGSVRLFAVAKEGGYGVKNVTLTAGDTSDIGSFAIDHVGGTVTGKVVDASGKAAASATVTAVGGLLSTTTDTAGAFSLANVPSSATVTIAKNTQGVTVSGVAVKAGGSTDLSTLRLSTLTTGTLPSLEDGYAVGLTTDSVITLVAVTASGSDTSWHIHRYLWNAGSGWDTTRTNVRRLTPSSLGGAGSFAVSVKASLYKLSGGLLLDSVTSPAAITVHISFPLDTLPPTLTRVSPTLDTSTHVWTDSVVTVSWKVSDDRKLDTVWLGGRVATVTGGVVSKTDTLAVGATTVRVVARDSSGNVTRDSVTLIRLPESATDLSLSSLVLSTGTLTPSFSSSTLSYTDTLASTDSLLVVTAKPADTTASLSIGGTKVTSGKADTLLVKKDTIVSIVVSHGSSTLTYTVKVVHKAARASGASASGTFKDARDGQSYKWVTIGTQTWMAQNLNYKRTGSDSGWCYNSDTSNCSKYGRLYTWAEAMDTSFTYNTVMLLNVKLSHQGVCPSGWHVPSDAEWSALVRYVDSAKSGTKLKSMGKWIGNTLGDDSYGFNAMPAGYYYDSFYVLGSYTGFWTSFEIDGSNAVGWNFYSDSAFATRSHFGYKPGGLSLRCVQGTATNTSSDTQATLHSLALDSGTLTATFDSSVTSYVDSVASTVTSLKVTARASSASDTIKINGTVVKSGAKDTVNGTVVSWEATSVNVSTDTTITIVVNNPNTASAKTYTVRVVHKAAGRTAGASASGTFTDTRDGQTYKWVTIGSQTWMAQNLNYKGSGTDTIGHCALDSCSKYGRWYSWAEVMDLDTGYNMTIWAGSLPRQGICLSGWHVPSDTEWGTLIAYVGSDSVGTVLRSSSGWANGGNGTDKYGFTVLPPGARFGTLYNNYYTAYFWSSSEDAASIAWYRYFGSASAFVTRNYSNKSGGFSLRCVKDN